MYQRAKLKNNISIVFTARNDNYGGDLLDRINALIKVLIFFTNKHKSNFELIIVEYNPPSDRQKLHEVLSINNNKHLKIKFIEFPAAYHKKFENSERIKLFEYIGKNIGIRRATGDFIVSTNQDIIFSEDFIKHLTYVKFDKNKFYRTDRIDVSLNRQAFLLKVDKLLEFCEKNAYIKKTMKGDEIINYFKINSIITIIKNIVYRIINFKQYNRSTIKSHNLHTFAAGDFLMFHRNIWKKLQGYSETKTGNDYLDSLILFNANCLNISQVIIPYPMYHIDHQMSKFGRPAMKQIELIKIINGIIMTNMPYLPNRRNWGQNKSKLDEKNI